MILSFAKRSALARPFLIGMALLLLTGCKFDFAGGGCKQLKSDSLHVAPGQTCKFNYAHGDAAKYVVIVTGAPAHGEANGEGRFLRYVAKPGFVGVDQLRIKVVRKGVAHVQWEDLTVKVKVGPAA
jgi:hypothetical protein